MIEAEKQIKEKLIKRANRKILNNPAIVHLLNLDSPLNKQYWSTYYCSSAIQQKNGSVISKYCKRRWCNVCAPIRTAVRLTNYSPLLMALPDLQFTTLTMPNVPGEKLKESLQTFRKVFRQWRNTYNKPRIKIGRTAHLLEHGNLDEFNSLDFCFKGVYNFESTINSYTGLYHPHVHIIHQGIDKWAVSYTVENTRSNDGGKTTKSGYSNELISYWLKNNPTSSIAGQDTKPCTKLIEGFKYTNKAISTKKIHKSKKTFIPVKELDVMYQQLAGLRCFQPFGIKIMSEEQEDKEMDVLTAYQSEKPEGLYLWNKTDWELEQHIDKTTGEILTYIPEHSDLAVTTYLTNNKPSEKFIKFIEKLSINADYEPPGQTVESSGDHKKATGPPSGIKKLLLNRSDLQGIFDTCRKRNDDAANAARFTDLFRFEKEINEMNRNKADRNWKKVKHE